MESDLFMQIEYDPTEYETLETQNMGPELSFKLVKFNTGYYGVISHNPVSNKEKIILVSPEQDINDEWALILGGLGCRSFLVFARDAKNYMENSPRELLVMLGREAPTEYREIITADDERTLREKVELCIERMEMKHEDSFFYRHANKILTILWCITVIALIVAIVNILQVGGVI